MTTNIEELKNTLKRLHDEYGIQLADMRNQIRKCNICEYYGRCINTTRVSRMTIEQEMTCKRGIKLWYKSYVDTISSKRIFLIKTKILNECYYKSNELYDND